VHPDIVLAGLRRELQRFPDRKTEIEAEIARVSKLPRPAVAVDDPATTVDRTAALLAALQREKARSVPERHAEIDAEIARVKAQARSGSVSRAAGAPPVETAVDQTTIRPAKPSAGR
jgi:hypothetical protein